MIKRQIGVFITPNHIPTSQEVYSISRLGEIRYISHNQGNIGPIDALIILDEMGIIPCSPNLGNIVPHFPIDPFFYYFWNNMVPLKMVEERGIPVLGIGHAAAMLYLELIGGSIDISHVGQLSFNACEKATLLTSTASLKDETGIGFIANDKPILGHVQLCPDILYELATLWDTNFKGNNNEDSTNALEEVI